jgi:RNA polymerase sigma-70 factor (ECF subfamily)
LVKSRGPDLSDVRLAGDRTLVERARAGDAAAFEALVRRYLRAAYAVALAITEEPADAEDVCQEAFLAALEKLEDCRDPDRFAGWILQITRNRAYNLRRYLALRRGVPLDEIRERPAPDDPLVDAGRSQLRERLLHSLAQLPEIQREIVLLHDLEGWRHREIAQALHMAEGTVRAHLSLARHALRQKLGRMSLEEV